ncbi:MAG: STAS domain-containing protein [Gallionellaceae bacterium]|jgi:anti-anti-sigma factor
MNSLTPKKLHINVSAINNTATLHLSGHFSFGAHREFKNAYKIQIDNASISNIVINLADVQYLDSSALGMLLILREHVQSTSKTLTLSRPSTITSRTFDIAGFDQLFSIN